MELRHCIGLRWPDKPKPCGCFIEYRASVNAADGMFSGSPLLWASHGWNNHRDIRDYVDVARLLIGAGASREWIPPEKMPDPEAAQEELAELVRAAEGAA